jgi:glyoxylate/hydroxypyruvate/2-ketogluconate reductase
MTSNMHKPKVLVARQIFQEGIERLEAFSEIVYNDQPTPLSLEQLTELLSEVDGALVTGSERINGQTLAQAKQLKVVSNIAVGFNNFDVDFMTQKGIMATNTPEVLTDTTADMGFMLLMAAARRLSECERWLRAGHWQNWSLGGMMGVDIHHSTIGIMGMGRIGQAIAKRALAFGMQVIYYNRRRLPLEIEQACQATYVSKEALLRQADHVMLVMPYTPENHHFIGAKELALMKPTATLINIARGGIVDEDALVKALKQEQIFAAGLDVYEGEPNINPGLLEVANIVLAPHIGSATKKTRTAMMHLAIDNLQAGLQGQKPLNLINAEVWRGN